MCELPSNASQDGRRSGRRSEIKDQDEATKSAKAVKTRKLYKFRPLGDQESFNRAKELLQTGKFYCSKLWEQNDPMEGVYCYRHANIQERDLVDVFSEKNKFRVCSFSGREALELPTMWGYYANGFKGVAIEIEVPTCEVHQVSYQHGPHYWMRRRQSSDIESEIQRVITTKLMRWKHESEFRFLTLKKEPKQEIGRISGIYLGDPYQGIENLVEVVRNSDTIRKYTGWKSKLQSIAANQGIPCYTARIENKEQNWRVCWKRL